ncbi:MAG: hypothetical protein MI749_10300 [Desulfovibrionales bacterium]|nr:hypothetical protein [Desulfovibrionales bacterium]
MGGGKSSGSSYPVAPLPPVQEDYGVDKSSLYTSAAKNQYGQQGRRSTILTGSDGDESQAKVKKSTLLGS